MICEQYRHSTDIVHSVVSTPKELYSRESTFQVIRRNLINGVKLTPLWPTNQQMPFQLENRTPRSTTYLYMDEK